ncbi:hypothetical protein MACK_001119 [Theileria orientalis]|uniref:Uncharacterized protein n=1 Tax=Theileria orientalis TaxID=68886 RepID=A0A976MCC3_THEOR|nr:hypothetical protein MACK_001119 [Theileria orientalis]
MVDEGKVVTIYLDGNKTRVFKKDAKNQPWNEIDLSKVTRSSINIDFPYESYFYKNELKNNIRTFTAKKGFLFNCANEYINNQKVEIWKTDDESEYVNKIEIDLMNNDTKAVTICFHDNKTKVYKKQSKNESWNEIDISKVNPMLVDITDDKETYFYLNKLDKNVKTFEAKNGFAFNVVSDCVNNNNVEIWKTDKESEYVNKIEMDLMDNNSKAVKIYFPENKTKVFMKDGKTEPWKEIDTDKVNLTSVNIQYQYDSYFYTNILVNEVRTFEPRDGFVFNGLREGDTVIWTTTDQSEYANKIVSAKRSVGKIDVTVKLGNGKKKLFVKEDANEQWKEIDLTVINPRSMNIRYDKETYFYSNNLDKDVRTFEAQDGFAFNVVNEYIGNNKKEIWKTDKENEYAKKVVSAKRSSGIFDVTINLTNGAKKLFIKESDNDPWKEIDITKVNPMPVNITDCEETHFYSNKLLGSTRTFEARDGFAFNVVNEGSGSNKAEIWKTTNDNEYANKVVSAKRSSGIFDVTINLTNGTKKLFLKEPDKQWKEIDITKVNPMPVNITDREETHFYSNKMLGSTRTFEARDGFAFNAVNEQIGSNKVEIWKTTNVEEYAKKVEYPKRSSGMLDITIDLSNGKKKLFVKDTEDEGWKEIDINKVNPKSVNIQDRYHSYFYTTSFNNDVRTFTAKTGFLFDSVFEYVSGNRVEVWKTDKENEYAKKVVARENKVTIYIGDDGTAKAFNKGSEGLME